MNSIFTGTISNTDVDAAEDIVEISNDHVDRPPADRLWISFTVTTADLTAFVVQYKTHADGSYFNVASAAGDYTTPNNPVVDASGDLTVAAAGSTVHWVCLNVRGIHSIKIRAAGANTIIAGHYSKA